MPPNCGLGEGGGREKADFGDRFQAIQSYTAIKMRTEGTAGERLDLEVPRLRRKEPLTARGMLPLPVSSLPPPRLSFLLLFPSQYDGLPRVPPSITRALNARALLAYISPSFCLRSPVLPSSSRPLSPIPPQTPPPPKLHDSEKLLACVPLPQ